MRIAEFALERFFARWEFAAKHLLCASDVEGWAMADVLALADDETKAMWDGLKLGYTESTGHPLLRAEIASLYESVEPDGVLVFAGAEEAIFCLSNVLLGPGDHAIVVWPGYQSLYEVGRATGANVSLHALRVGDGWALDVERIRRSLHPNTRLVVINAPHNPTGMLPSAAEWRALTELCADADVHLLADEVYRYLEFDEGHRLTAGADVLERGVSLGVMSKSFAMAGLRIGWLASRDRDLLARCGAFKDYTTICSSAPSEILALIALRARDRVLARSREIVLGNLPLLDAFFERWPGTFSWVRPRGGSIAFPRLLDRRTTIDKFAAELVETEGVLIAPGSIFGMADGHFRIGFGRTNLPDALAGLGPELAEQARRAEAIGYHALVIADHLIPQFAPIPGLTWIAAATERLRVASFVHNNDLRHPAVLAQDLATLDNLSGGRLDVAIGAGWNKPEYDAIGLPFDPTPVRQARLIEAITVLKGAFGDGPFSFAGEHYTITDLDGQPKPVQKPHPPFLIGGGGQRTLELAGREAQIVGLAPRILKGQRSDPNSLTLAATAEKIEWVRAAAGDRFDSLEFNVYPSTTNVSVTEAALPEARELAAALAGRTANDVSAEELLESPHIFVGSLASLEAKFIRQRDELGISSIMVGEMGPLDSVVEHLAGR